MMDWNQLGKLPPVVAFVGAGGKTTLLYDLACHLAGQGKRVLVTTTTHIYIPSPECYAPGVSSARALWAGGSFAVIGAKSPAPGKLGPPEPEVYQTLAAQADHILVEADGSRGHPVKAPRDWEPVIPAQAGLVMAVLGLSALGQPLKACCFGLEQALHILQAESDHILTQWDAAALLASPAGGRKGTEGRDFRVILNQCDDDCRRQKAQVIARALKTLGIEWVYTSSFTPRELAFFRRLSNGAME